MDKSVESSKLKVEFLEDEDKERKALMLKLDYVMKLKQFKYKTHNKLTCKTINQSKTELDRQTKAIERYDYANLIAYAMMNVDDFAIEELDSHSKTIKSENCNKYIEVMQKKIDFLQRNQTQILILNSYNKKIASCQWIFKKNDGILGFKPSRYKTRLTQREGTNFNEIFSFIVKHNSIRILLTIVALLDMELQPMDVKTSFLNRKLKEQILMTLPKGFAEIGKDYHICLLNKSLYCLKQSPRQVQEI